MESPLTNNARFSQEDIEFVFELADTSIDDLLELVSSLEKQQTRIQNRLALAHHAVSRRKPTKSADPLVDPIVSTKTTNLPATQQKTAIDGIGNQNKKRIKDRELNLQEFIETKGWVYRTLIEQEFEDERLNEVRATNPAIVREFVRQLLRRSREKGNVIDRTAYTTSSHNNRVIATLMYGSPKFENPDFKEYYDRQYKQEIKELGFYETKEEAEAHSSHKAFNGQMQLVAH